MEGEIVLHHTHLIVGPSDTFEHMALHYPTILTLVLCTTTYKGLRPSYFQILSSNNGLEPHTK